MANSTKQIRVTAKTLKNAIKQAATTLKVHQDSVEYRVVSQTSGGFFSFLGKKIEISAWKKPTTSATAKNPNPATATEQNIDCEALIKDLQKFCQQLCSMISDEKCSVSAVLENKRLVLDVDCEYLGDQVAKNGKLAESLEHVLRKKPRYLKRELPFRIFVDVNGARQKREGELIDLAKGLSQKVSENRRPIVLNYKSSYDRKIIHLALDQDQKVYTKSVGNGPNRKLMILPAKKKDSSETQVSEVHEE